MNKPQFAIFLKGRTWAHKYILGKKLRNCEIRPWWYILPRPSWHNSYEPYLFKTYDEADEAKSKYLNSNLCNLDRCEHSSVYVGLYKGERT